ncbi:MAG: gluconokinase [Armatimonadota bacterium]
MEYVLGLDLGTTSIKLVAFDLHAKQVAVCQAPNPITVLEGGSRVTSADEVLEVVNGLMTQMATLVPRDRVAGIGISTAMFAIQPVSTENEPLSMSRSWADGVKQKPLGTGHAEFYMDTGCRMNPIYPLYKIRRMQLDHPELEAPHVRWVSTAEYLFFKLTGEWLVSKSIASCSGLLNVHTLAYHQPALDWAHLSDSQLSPLADEDTVRPIKNGAYAGVPLVIGATDGPLCHYGTNSLSRGQMTSTIGTSAAVRIVSERPLLDEQMRTWCYYLGNNLWAVGGAINGGGIALQWLREQLLGTDVGSDALVSDAIHAVAAGCDGLTVVPELMGERCPGWDENMRGAIYGLSLNHTKHHLVRAIIEGILYRLLNISLIVQQLSGLDEIVLRASGGYANNKSWVQVQADLFGCPVELPMVTEASALGAACFAAQASGLMSAASMAQGVVSHQRHLPDADLYEAYQQAYKRSERLWAAVSNAFGGK